MTTSRFRADRRFVLKAAGLSLAMPLLGPLARRSAHADTHTRHRFIGVFIPNGAHMPSGADGNWNFSEALAPLVQAGFRDNTAIIRGLFNGFPGVDPHWQNAAGFLSCQRIVLGNAAVARCGTTVDQLVAEAHPAPLRSLEVGAPYYHVHPLDDHPGYSNDYLNRISWQSPDRFRAPIAQPRQMFAKIFANDAHGAAHLAYLRARKRSVLDALHKDATRLAQEVGASYRPVLDEYMTTVREVEGQLDVTAEGCQAPFDAPSGDFANPNQNYVLRYHLMHQMIAVAMQCGAVNAATIMYGPSSSDLTAAETIGSGAGHHSCAHNRGEADLIQRLRGMNLLHSELLAHLLTQLRDRGLMSDTLVLAGSDMSDGDQHNTTNIPTLVFGEGSDLRLGETIGSRASARPYSNLHVELMQLLGLQVSSFGAGRLASTDTTVGLRS